MSLEIWLAYCATVFIFLVSPGPSHLFMLSTSLSNGFKRSWATGAGDLTGHIWQITAASIGLVSFIYAFAEMFIVIKWAGVAFLIYLGISQFRKKGLRAGGSGQKDRGLSSFFWQGFVTSSANPKAVVFFAALFPQFVDPSAHATRQFVILGITYMAIDGCFLMFYGLFADWISKKFESHIERYLNKVSGALLILSAILLGLRDIQEVK